MNIHAYNGNVTLVDDKVFAHVGDTEETGNVNIESGGTLTVGVINTSVNSVNSGSWDTIIDAGGSVNLT